MIFKKPYAFLIKHFKLIHFILVAFSIYIAYRTYNIISFFNDYIVKNYSGNFYPGFSETYVSSFIYFIIILLIIGIACIYFLLVYKKKPTKTYLISIIYYVIFIIFLIILKNVLVTLETSVITAEQARIYRDLSLISILPQGLFILLFLFRSFGFNLGKFNFKEDIKEIEISDEDSEEIEINIKKDDFKLKRNLRRFIREFKYYIRENKFIFIIICIVFIVVLGIGIYNILPEIVDQDYKQGDYFYINNLRYRIEDSIITNLDYKGDIIQGDYYYVISKVYIENNTKKDAEIDFNNFRLVVGDNYVYPTKDKGNYFIDYAVNYTGSSIKKESKQIYSLVFKINEKDVKKNYEIKISNGSALSDNKLVGKFNYITITPIVINKVTTESAISLDEELSLANSNLGNTTILLSNPIITDKYTYDYEYCYIGVCNIYKDIVSINYTKNDKLLLVLDYKYNIDESIPYYKVSSTINGFVSSFVKIKYIENGKIKYASIQDVTPTKLKNKLVIETTNKIKDLEDVALAITIRNKEYNIKIK